MKWLQCTSMIQSVFGTFGYTYQPGVICRVWSHLLGLESAWGPGVICRSSAQIDQPARCWGLLIVRVHVLEDHLCLLSVELKDTKWKIKLASLMSNANGHILCTSVLPDGPRPPPWHNPRKGRDPILQRSITEP